MDSPIKLPQNPKVNVYLKPKHEEPGGSWTMASYWEPEQQRHGASLYADRIEAQQAFIQDGWTPGEIASQVRIEEVAAVKWAALSQHDPTAKAAPRTRQVTDRQVVETIMAQTRGQICRYYPTLEQALQAVEQRFRYYPNSTVEVFPVQVPEEAAREVDPTTGRCINQTNGFTFHDNNKYDIATAEELIRERYEKWNHQATQAAHGKNKLAKNQAWAEEEDPLDLALEDTRFHRAASKSKGGSEVRSAIKQGNIAMFAQGEAMEELQTRTRKSSPTTRQKRPNKSRLRQPKSLWKSRKTTTRAERQKHKPKEIRQRGKGRKQVKRKRKRQGQGQEGRWKYQAKERG